MRVSCLQENLAKGISIVGRAVSTRSTLPVLANILMEAKDNELRLAATNLEIGVNCWIGAKIEDEGMVAVPARLLADFVNSLPPEKIEMEYDVRTSMLHLRCARYEANIKCAQAEEFPILPTAGAMHEIEESTETLEGTRTELQAYGLRKMIDQVVFAASTDESRPTLTGVEVSFSPDRLTMAATDGYRLSVRSVAVEQPNINETMTVIIPARSLSELARVSVEGDDERPVNVIVTESRNQVLFQIWGRSDSKGGFHRVELVIQLIEARFPDYHAIVPKSHTTRTIVNTAALLNAARVAHLFARDSANIIRVTVTPGDEAHEGQVCLTATSAEMGDNVNDLDAMVEGEDLEIAFNARYLIDVLSQIDEPEVVLETTQSTRPGTIRPIGLGEDEFLHVIMPMHPPR